MIVTSTQFMIRYAAQNYVKKFYTTAFSNVMSSCMKFIYNQSPYIFLFIHFSDIQNQRWYQYIDGLVDWSLMPPLAVFQLYHGGDLLTLQDKHIRSTLPVFKTRKNKCYIFCQCMYIVYVLFLGLFYITIHRSKCVMILLQCSRFCKIKT